MLPYRSFLYKSGGSTFSTAAQQLIAMSACDLTKTDACQGDQLSHRRCQDTQQHFVTNRKCIEVQQPSDRRRLTRCQDCSVNESTHIAATGRSHDTSYSCNSAPPRTNDLGSAIVTLQVTDKLSYPDLSFSSFATTRDVHPSIDSPSNSDAQASWVSAKPSSTDMIDRAKIMSSSDVPFQSPGGFHIPRYKFETAANSRPGSAASFWQYTLYEGPGVEKKRVKLHYCKNQESTETVSQMFLKENMNVIGFDIEWMAQAKATDGIKSNVALIQFACEERIALFHIARFPGPETKENLVTPTLRKIMESPDISKVGVAIKGDCTRLRNFLGIQCQGLFELSHLHKLVQYRSGQISKLDRRNVRLADQVQEHLKLPLHKGNVQTSNWSRDLDYQQTQYAASDSYAGFQLFHILEAKRKALNPIPPRPAHAELNLQISLGDEDEKEPLAGQTDHEDHFCKTQPVSDGASSMEELAQEYFRVSLQAKGQRNEGAREDTFVLCDSDQHPQVSNIFPQPRFSTTFKDEMPSTEVANSPELEIAHQFAAAFKPTGNRRVPPQALRAYSLWYKQGLTIPEVASRLRNPPILHSTVLSYLCDAICMGNLDCQPGKLLGLASEYGWRPYSKAHQDFIDKAKNEILREQMVKQRRSLEADDCVRECQA